MSRYDREVASEAIAQSLVDGPNGPKSHLDLAALRANLAEKAREVARHDPHYADAVHDGDLGEYIAKLNANFNRGAKEVLGVIPRSQWDYSTADGMTNLMARGADAVLGSTADSHGVVCNVPAGHSIDPNKSLMAQGVRCDIPRTRY